MNETITIKSIIDVTGVKKSTVSSWRSRYSDFPDPIPGRLKRPELFDKDAVLAWLETHRPDAIREERYKTIKFAIRIMLENLRTESEDSYEAALTALRLLYFHQNGITTENASTWEEIRAEIGSEPGAKEEISIRYGGLTAHELALLGVYASIPTDHWRETCESVLHILLSGLPASVSTSRGTPESASSRILAVAASTSAHRNGWVYDSVCGIGSALIGLDAGNLVSINDIDATSVGITALRLHFHGFMETEVSAEDVLVNDVAELNTFDLVIAEAPHHTQSSATGFDRDAGRWQEYKNAKGAHSADAAFILDALNHLHDDGYAYVLTGGNLLSARDLEALRIDLVAKGRVEAVIEIPSLRSNSSQALWVLRKSGHDRVVIIDAMSAAEVTDHLPSWLQAIREGGAPSANHAVVTPASMSDRAGQLRVVAYQGGHMNAADAERSWESAAYDVEEMLPILAAYAGNNGKQFIDAGTGLIVEPIAVDACPDFSKAALVSIAQLIRRGAVELIECHIRPRPNPQADWHREVLVLPVGYDDKSTRVTAVRVPDNYSAGQSGDVIVPIVGVHDAVKSPMDEFAVTSSARVLRIIDRSVVSAEFLTRCVNAEWNASNVTSAGVPRRALRDLMIPLISVQDQENFCGYLGRLDEFQNVLKRANEVSAKLQTMTMNAIDSSARA